MKSASLPFCAAILVAMLTLHAASSPSFADGRFRPGAGRADIAAASPARACCITAVADPRPGRTLRPGPITRPDRIQQPPRMALPTLQVQQFSGDFARWVDHMSIEERGVLTFRWKNLRGNLSGARWQIARSANAPVRDRPGHIGEGRLPRVPAQGAFVGFKIDMKRFLPTSPPAVPRKYYVRVVVMPPGKPAYIDSRPVVLTYQRPNQQITQFTDEGLSTPTVKGTSKSKCCRNSSGQYYYGHCSGPVFSENNCYLLCCRKGSRYSYETLSGCESGNGKIVGLKFCHGVGPVCCGDFLEQSFKMVGLAAFCSKGGSHVWPTYRCK